MYSTIDVRRNVEHVRNRQDILVEMTPFWPDSPEFSVSFADFLDEATFNASLPPNESN